MSILTVLETAVDPHIAETTFVGLMLGASQVWNHMKGRRRDRRNAVNAETLGRIERGQEELMRDLEDLTGDVRDLHAHVVGPDGQNGLRGDVRELKVDVKGLLSRERDRLHGPYTNDTTHG